MLKEHHAKLVEIGLTPKQIKRVTDAARCLQREMQEEVDNYERVKRGEFRELINLQGLGELLIGLRLFLGVSQRELARRVGIDESQVSRDERNEYRGISLERAAAILETLGARLITRVDLSTPGIQSPRSKPMRSQ